MPVVDEEVDPVLLPAAALHRGKTGWWTNKKRSTLGRLLVRGGQKQLHFHSQISSQRRSNITDP